MLGLVRDLAKGIDYALMANGAGRQAVFNVPGGRQTVTRSARDGSRRDPIWCCRISGHDFSSKDEIIRGLRAAQTPVAVAIGIGAGIGVGVVAAVRYATTAFCHKIGQRPAQRRFHAVVAVNVRGRKEIVRHHVAFLANLLGRQKVEKIKMRGMRAHRWFSRKGFAVQTLGRSGVDQNRRIAARIAVTQITGLRAALLSVASQTGCALFHHGIILAMTRLAGIQIVAIISQKNEMRGRSCHKIIRMRVAGVAFFA